jgi:hypothetical protein
VSKKIQPAQGDVSTRVENPSEMQQQLMRMAEALSELYDLLEQYAPSWYTAERHEKTKAALQGIRSRKQIGKAV